MELLSVHWWWSCAVLFTIVIICSAQIKKKLHREEKKVNPDLLPEVDVQLDFFSYNEGCWHCYWIEDNAPMYGLVWNLKDPNIEQQTIRVKKHKAMAQGLYRLEAIQMSLPAGHVILIGKTIGGWLCKYPNKLGIAATGVVHHTVHLIGKHLRPGKLLKVIRLGEKDFEPTDLEPASEQ